MPQTVVFSPTCDQARRDPGRIAPEPLDKLGIPQMVQVVAGEPVSSHQLPIAAGIVIVGSMKGLVHVPDEMKQDLAALPLAQWLARVPSA
jgi:hypothetical protein